MPYHESEPPHAGSAAPTSRRTARAAGRSAPPRVPIELGLDVVRARWWLWAAMVSIVALDVLASVAAALGAPYLVTRFFDGDYKVNFPTGYKLLFLFGVTLLFALLSGVARREGDRFAPGWLLLAAVSGFACLDETVWLHQSVSEVLHHGFNTTGPLRFAWTIVYVPAAVAVFVILLRYLRHLGQGLRWPLLVGGFLYGGGAVLLEPVKSHFSEAGGEQSLLFKLAAALSDSAEMIGLTLLVVVLLTEVARRVGAVAVILIEDPSTSAAVVPEPDPATAPVTAPATEPRS